MKDVTKEELAFLYSNPIKDKGKRHSGRIFLRLIILVSVIGFILLLSNN